MSARSTRWLVVLVCFLTFGAVFAQAPRNPPPPAENLVIGTWTLVVEKSRYNPGPPPQSQTRTYEAQGKGVKTTIRTVLADGQTTTVSYTANYDSVEYRVSGSPTADGIALIQIDPHIAEAKLMHAGRVVGVARRLVAADGKTMTIELRDTRGTVQNVAVYQKQ
jgi:hypothetical protein